MKIVSLTGELLEDQVYLLWRTRAVKLDKSIMAEIFEKYGISLREDRLDMEIEQPHYARLQTIMEFNL
jgi:hypothetical protein